MHFLLLFFLQFWVLVFVLVNYFASLLELKPSTTTNFYTRSLNTIVPRLTRRFLVRDCRISNQPPATYHKTRQSRKERKKKKNEPGGKDSPPFASFLWRQQHCLSAILFNRRIHIRSLQARTFEEGTARPNSLHFRGICNLTVARPLLICIRPSSPTGFQ